MKVKKLRVERFLDEMERVVPWGELVKTLAPHYKQDGGRPPHDVGLMLRVHFLQLWHNLSDPAMEEALYDRLSFQKFPGFDCFGGVIPDESSICRFRHLLEQRGLAKTILACVNGHLEKHGLILNAGTIVDATLLQAPVSKKNGRGERDPEMSSTRKNNQWHPRLRGGRLRHMKGHIGVQAPGKPIIHSTEFSTAKDNDMKELEKLLHGKEKAVFGDSAYVRMADKHKARADGVYYGISDRGFRKHPLSGSQKKRNRRRSSVRAKVEHPFRVIKHLWGHYKLRYKGLLKNAAQFTTLCALSNIYFCRKALLAAG